MDKFKYWSSKPVEVKEEELEEYKSSGIFYRPSTSDKEMIRDCMKNYSKLDIKSSDIVLDLGANIGGFSATVARQCKSLYSVEADLFNCEVLKRNLKGLNNCDIMHAAVVPDDYEDPTITFLINNSKKSACSGKAATTDKISKRYTKQTVRAIKFSDIIKTIKPTVLKIDIEGGEYGIIDRPIPYCIEQIGGELHGMSKETNKLMFEAVEILKKDWEFLEEDYETVFGSVSLLNFQCVRK